MSVHHVDDLIAAYSLGALTPAERERVEEHLSACSACADLAGGAGSVTALLPYAATPYKAPADLKLALFSRLQTIPATTPISHAAGNGAARAGRKLEPPSWARTDLPPWWAQLLLRTVPWTAAVVGWILVAALLVYSRGQSDRLNTTQQDLQSQIAALRQDLAGNQLMQSYLAIPNVSVVALGSTRPVGKATGVSLVVAPRYLHALIVARGLAVLPTNQIYEVWGKPLHGPFESLGTLTTSGPQAAGVSQIVGHRPIRAYLLMGLSIERAPGVAQPSTPMLFAVALP